MRKLVPVTLAGLMLVTSGYAAAVTQVVTERGVTYVSGGVGDDDQEKLLAEQKNFNLKLLFTLNEGNYVADVNVVVSDAKGNMVIEHLAQGPFFMAKLPPTQYTVSATYEGKTITRRVRISSDRLHTEHLRWPSNPATDFVISRADKQ